MKKWSAAVVVCAIVITSGAVIGGDVEDCGDADVALSAVSSSAVAACRRLADQGDALGQYKLGQMYKLGRGVQRNYDEAVRWFRRAAKQGNAGAQYNLAYMYESGRGVRRDLVRAYMWFDLASRSTDTSVHQRHAMQYRDSVARNMTPAQIEEAQRLVQDWKPEINP